MKVKFVYVPGGFVNKEDKNLYTATILIPKLPRKLMSDLGVNVTNKK